MKAPYIRGLVVTGRKGVDDRLHRWFTNLREQGNGGQFRVLVTGREGLYLLVDCVAGVVPPSRATLRASADADREEQENESTGLQCRRCLHMYPFCRKKRKIPPHGE
ncbi:hypothetical protein [Methanogenium cariaci]|uniref:hypothetical protein n=1 Tax=Methanogenium cariaci TaxID=2197 RepID=UPI0012F6A004|nr:hypothetical protein [Methanogenium cariaci]